VEGSGRDLIYDTVIFLNVPRKTTEALSQESRILGRDLNRGTAAYEAGILISRPQRSMVLLLLLFCSNHSLFHGTESMD
jgi:hypothetical protein